MILIIFTFPPSVSETDVGAIHKKTGRSDCIYIPDGLFFVNRVGVDYHAAMQTKKKKPVERRSNAERSAETQERILEATLECLSEKGYAATSTNEVVRRAGVSRGALVHHFSSKSELVAAAAVHLVRRRYAATQMHPRNLENDDLSIRDRLAIRRRDYERWFPATIEFMVACRTDKALSESFAQAMRPYEKNMGQSILEEWPELANHESPLMIQYVTGCFIRGLCLESIVNPESITDQVFEEFAKMVSVYAKHG